MDLRDLYQSTILDHNKKPRNFRVPEGANRQARGNNPMCGDQLSVHLLLDGDRVADVGFQGTGCAISRASASLMTESVRGRKVDEALALFDRFHELLTSDPTEPPDIGGIGKLEVFAGVREFPMRVKCATLAWHTLRAAVLGDPEPVRTE